MQQIFKPTLPARLSAEQVAEILNFQAHDIPTLTSAGMLKPLGKPVQNSIKYYARAEILKFADDVNFLHRATKIVADHWAKQNARKKSAHGSGSESLAA